MHLVEVDFGNRTPIDGYGPDFIRLGGQPHAAPVLIAPGHVRPWGGYEDTATLLALAGQVDVVLIGTGGDVAHLPRAFRDVLEEAGLGVESMDTPAACRTYNVLLSEARRIAVAVLPVG